MSENLQVNLCRIVPPEKLSDRFLACGLLSPAAQTPISESVVLAYVIEIHKPWFPSSKILSTLVSTLEEEHAKLKPGSDVDSQFEGLLRILNQNLNTLSEEGETDWIGNLSGMIMVLSGDELHFSETGHCPAYLLQNNRIRQISDNTGLEKDPHPLKTFANLASGHLEGNEHVLIANHELYSEISLDALRRILNTSTPYTASMAIARHLRKERNPGIASIIIQVTEAGTPLQAEPDYVDLAEIMQSTAKKVGKQLVPVGQTLSAWTSIAAKQTGAGLSTAGKFVVKTVMPNVKKVGEQGLQALQSKKAEESPNDKATKDQAPETETTEVLPVQPPTQETETKVVERILPKELRDKPAEPQVEPANVQEEEAIEETQEEAAPEETPLIPASEFSLEEGIPAPEKTAKPRISIKLPPVIAVWVSKFRIWLKVPLHQKFAALALAIIILLPTVAYIRHRQLPSDINGKSTTNQELISKARGYEQEIATAITNKQDAVAGKKIEDAQATLSNLKNPTDKQTADANAIRQQLSTYSDTLTSTTRLQSPVALYAFPALSQMLVAQPPYFYGGNKTISALLRGGKGDQATAQATVDLPNSQDMIVSLAPGTDNDTAAIALTRQSKVYRVVAQGTQTFLRELSPESGSFVTADAIQTYAGNIYTLDGKSGLLWKYANTGSGYGKGTSVIDPVKYDLKDTVSLAIDGDIYILKTSGSLLKFTRGKQQTDFSLHGLPYLSRQIIQPRQVITNESLDNIYVLDAGLTSSQVSTAKVMVFSKDGAFISQYGFPSAYTDVQAFDIDPKQKTLWVVNGKEIGEFSLP